MSSPDKQAAFAALSEGRKTLTHLDRARGPEDAAADIIDLWNSVERALRALVGQESLSGQQLVRVARQGEIISLEQAHALLEFLAARDRANRTSYTPTPGDSDAAREGFRAMEAAASGSPAVTDDSPYAPSSPYAPPSPYAPQSAGATPYAAPSKQNVPYEGPAATPPGAYSVAATPIDRWRGIPLWLKIGIPVLVLLLLIVGGYYMTAGRNSAPTHLNAGITAMQNGQRETARQDFAQAASSDNDKLAEPHIFLARLSREDGDLATARAQLDEALRLEPGNHVALRELGLVMFASRNYDLARRFFVRAAAADSTDRAALGYLGCALMRLNRTVEATRFLSRAGNGAWSACAPASPILSPPL